MRLQKSLFSLVPKRSKIIFSTQAFSYGRFPVHTGCIFVSKVALQILLRACFPTKTIENGFSIFSIALRPFSPIDFANDAFSKVFTLETLNFFHQLVSDRFKYAFLKRSPIRVNSTIHLEKKKDTWD